jgi:hypothetical protein
MEPGRPGLGRAAIFAQEIGRKTEDGDVFGGTPNTAGEDAQCHQDLAARFVAFCISRRAFRREPIKGG